MGEEDERRKERTENEVKKKMTCRTVFVFLSWESIMIYYGSWMDYLIFISRNFFSLVGTFFELH